MDLPKKSRIPTRVSNNPEKSNKNQGKENVAELKKTVEEVRTHFKSHTTTTTTRHSDKNEKVPRRHQILSDSAILPPEKKIKIAEATRSKLEGSTRPPLGDLDKNIANKHGAIPKARVEKNVRITKTVFFKNLDGESTHIRKKVEETIKSEKVINIKHGAATNTYHSKCTHAVDYKKLQVPTIKGLPRSTSTSSGISVNKPTVPNQDSKIKTPESDRTYNVDRKNITVRRSLTPYPNRTCTKSNGTTRIVSDFDEIFVGSSEHFITFKQPERSYCKGKIRHMSLHESGYISPIKANLYATKSAVIFQGIPDQVRRPAKKMSLMHKSQPGSRKGNSEAYCLDIYNMEYLEDIIYCQLRNDWKYILKLKVLKLYNPLSIKNRAAIVNWLIQAQDYLDLSPAVLFSTIRLFDRVLEHTSIACNMCQLVALVILWIINKFQDNKVTLTATKMLALCNGVYSKRDFLKMEKKLLTFFNFDLNIPDITIYVTFYLKQLKIDSDLLVHCVFYILECYALNVKFSMVIPSVKAASAVRLALNIIYPLSKNWQQLENVIGYYSEEDLDDIMHEMLQQLHKIQDPAYEYRQPYQKYATKEKVQVSIVLLRKLVAT